MRVRDDIDPAIDSLLSHSSHIKAVQVVLGSKLGVYFQETLIIFILFWRQLSWRSWQDVWSRLRLIFLVLFFSFLLFLVLFDFPVNI